MCLSDVVAQWCSQGDLLAVAGMESFGMTSDPASAQATRNAIVKFYNVLGEHIYSLETPAQVSVWSRLKLNASMFDRNSNLV